MGAWLAIILMVTGAFPVWAAPGDGGSGLQTAGAGDPQGGPSPRQELRGVWISYLDWEKLPGDWAGFKKGVDQMMDRCVALKMNAVFVQVRPDADAMYPSEYFPWSRFITGTQGEDPGYDPLAYFVEAAHNRGLQFHAWINPYRVTGYLNRWNQVSEESFMKQCLTDGDPSNDRWVLRQNGEYYLNPAVKEVRERIINGVREIVDNYDVDGIHFDDYFYPEVNDLDENKWFDKPEYDQSGSTLSISDWRRENVNQLIRGVYQVVKEADSRIQFGISPEGYVDHLRSNSRLFADIDTWMTEEGYVDYIMPQIYWGFEHKLSDGSPAPFAFSNNLKTWIRLKNKGNVRLYLGLAMYKTGSGSTDNNAVPEWLRRNDIIKRQVEEGRASGQVSGYCFYAYSSFQESSCQAEVTNLMKAFR
ncbi:MAG: family 10 glycosylhydrolase [Lachnospiraceae bacterium]|nr:family 10 glycosylhydrolase [Lachnospiraceae bacterium]